MKKILLTISFFLACMQLVIPASVLLGSEPAYINTEKQETIRPSYPFPTFLSTGPYVWYENAKNKPTKGHTYRIATFSDEQSYNIYIEKVRFGSNGCCLEIIDYRQLMLDEQILRELFPGNKGQHGFKLIRWLKPESFEFHAYGGSYNISSIGSKKPLITEIQ